MRKDFGHERILGSGTLMKMLEARFGNHGLWAALCVFFVARGLTFASRMPVLEKRAFG